MTNYSACFLKTNHLLLLSMNNEFRGLQKNERKKERHKEKGEETWLQVRHKEARQDIKIQNKIEVQEIKAFKINHQIMNPQNLP